MIIKDVMKIEFDHSICDYKMPMIALFNITNTTENEALEAIKTYDIGENDKVIIISKTQFENVFR